MPDAPPVDGEEFQPLFLRLDEKRFVERVLLRERRVEGARRVAHGQRQERHLLLPARGDDGVRVERACASARRVRPRYFNRISRIDTALA